MKCLLIIISDPARAGLYGALALQAGVRVIQAEGALHALTFLEREQVDAIICEADMEDMDGDEFRTVVHEEVRTAGVPVFVLPDGREMVKHRHLELPALTGPEILAEVLDELGVDRAAFPVPVIRQPVTHLAGRLGVFGLAEFLSWVHEMEYSGHWLVTVEDEGGNSRCAHLLMTGGDLTYAEFAGMTGKAALFSVMRDVTLHPRASFEFVRIDTPLPVRSATLMKNTPRTLMEVAVDLDHLDAHIQGLAVS